MNFIRRHSYLVTAALVFVLLPLPLFAADPQDPALLFILKTLHSFVVAVFGLLVWLSALILEFSINNFVIGFGDTYSKSGVGVAVDTTWIIIRDFVNMGFIFGFVYIGFKMILNSNDSNTRRLLINILMAALLVNFSLFATKFVVDLSNQLAAQIAVNGLSEETKVVDKKTGLPKLDLAGALTQRMGVQGALSDGKNGLPQGAGFSYIIGVAILFLVTSFVFAAGGILLSIRFAMLTFFLMISPVMFLNWALPLVKKDTMSEYWSQFLGKAFFAPIYLLMIYFSFRVMSGMQTSIGTANGETNLANPDWAGTFQMVEGASPTSSALGTVPFFILICIFMIMSLVVAQRLGMEGGSKALSIGKSFKNKVQRGVTRTAGGATFGLAAKAGQATVGAGANAAANSRRFQGLAANNKLARYALAGTRKVADSSFDARHVGGVGKELGLGDGIKGGFATRIKNRNKKDEEFYKSLDDTDMESDEGKAAAAQLEAEKSAEAIAAREAGESELETIKAIAENEAKSDEQLIGEIDTLGEEIERLSAALTAQVAAGTITPQERASSEKLISDKTSDRNKNLVSWHERTEEKVLEDKIQQAGLDASLATGPISKAKFREKQQQLQAELNARRDLANRTQLANKRINKSKEDIATAKSEAYNEVKFANKIAFMKNLENKTRVEIGGKGSGIFTDKSFTPFEKESLANLKKKFGKDSNEMAKKAKQSGAAKDLAKQLKELQEQNSDGGDKKSDDKKDDAK